jgi:long-subunit acyl-CoA synthetase (AMP-forming)
MTGLLRPGDEEVIVTALPLYHVFALMVNFITFFSIGTTNWLVANPRDMDGLVEIFKQAHPSVFMGVNTLYAGLVAHPRFRELDFSNLKLCGGGGAAVIAATSAKWKEITGTFIREGYGLSETAPVLTFNPGFINEFSGSTGLPVPSTDIKLLDDEDRAVAIGERGEVCARGPQVMPGYWKQSEANAAAFTADGYFRTGDIGVFDERGFLRIVDDMIIVSGFNVYPNEVEATATACPGVAERACIGLPDEKAGEAVTLSSPRRRRDAGRSRCDRPLPQGNDGVQGSEARALCRGASEIDGRKDPAPGVARSGLRCVRKLRPVLSAEVPSAGGRALRTECDGGGWLSTDGRKQSCSDILCPRSGASKRCSKRSLDTCR